MTNRTRISARICAAVLALGLACHAASADIVIGVAGPLSGTFANFGAEMRDGAAQAVADINARGGVAGEPLQIEFMDDACTAKDADAVANQLAGKGAAMVAGHLCLDASLAASPVYAANRIVQLSPGTTFPKFTDERPGPGIFRLAARDDEQGLIAGNLLASRFADQKIAIVDDKSPYGKGLADATRQAMNAAGKRETFTDSYDPGQDDFSALVSRLKAAGIGVLYLGGYHSEAALIVREMRAAAMTTVLVGGDALVTEEFWRAAGSAGDGTLMTFAPDPRKNPEAAAVVEEFRARGIEPEGYVLPSYAAVEVWADAAGKAGSTDFDKVVAALGNRTFRSVLGEVSFDGRGDLALPGFVFYAWRDGKYDYFGR